MKQKFLIRNSVARRNYWKLLGKSVKADAEAGSAEGAFERYGNFTEARDDCDHECSDTGTATSC